MKRKFCLVRTRGCLRPEDCVFVVWVGSSLRESAFLSLVEEYCKDVGWYFKLWSAEVDSQLNEWSKQWRRIDGQTVQPYTMMAITINVCYQTIIDDSWCELINHRVMSPQETFLRFRSDPEYLRRLHARKRNTTCQPYRRKYLSQQNQQGFYNVGACLTLAFFLLVLDAIVTHLFHLV